MGMLDSLKKAHAAEVQALRRRIEVLERERGYYDGACALTYRFLVDKHPRLIPEFIAFIYAEEEDIDEHCPGAKAKDFAATFAGDVDLSAITEAARDFPKR